MSEFFVAVVEYKAGKRKFSITLCTSSLNKAYKTVMMHDYKITEVLNCVSVMKIYRYINNKVVEEYDMKKRILGVTDFKGNFIPYSTVQWIFREDIFPYYEEMMKDTEIDYIEPVLFPNTCPPKEEDSFIVNVPIYNKDIEFKLNHGYNNKNFENLILF